jgi:hypothetical protein
MRSSGIASPFDHIARTITIAIASHTSHTALAGDRDRERAPGTNAGMTLCAGPRSAAITAETIGGTPALQEPPDRFKALSSRRSSSSEPPDSLCRTPPAIDQHTGVSARRAGCRRRDGRPPPQAQEETRSTTHRPAATVVERRDLTVVPREGHGLGPTLLALGFRAHAAQAVPQVARPHLERPSQTCEDTIHLGILDGERALWLGQISGRRRVEISSRIGERHPVWSAVAARRAGAAFIGSTQSIVRRAS